MPLTPASTTSIEASINKWASDVNAVDFFLNTLPEGDAFLPAAQVALASAMDEPCQLGTMSSQANVSFPCLTSAINCVVSDLQDVSKTHVLDNLMKVIANV